MKKKPSNVFNIPKWMQNLKVVEPSGNKTPDQVSVTLELNMAFNDNSVDKLRDCIKDQIPLVPLKHQKMLKAFLAMNDASLVIGVSAFIQQCNFMVAELKAKEAPIEPTREELPVEPSGESVCGGVQLSSDWDSEDWGGESGPKPSSRGNRAVRAAKRKQADT